MTNDQRNAYGYPVMLAQPHGLPKWLLLVLGMWLGWRATR